jgi:uncharacterized surface protein with fasciclin (FAS1) repeats
MTRLLLTGLALGAALSQPIFAGDHKPTKSHCASTTTADIVKTAALNGNFKTLVSLLVAADLTDTLKSDGPFTVFAPTDDAFAKLPAGTLESLLKPENKALLTKILTYHVIAGKASFKFENAWNGQTSNFKTVNGAQVSLKIDSNGVRVNDAKIIAKNVPCSNGSIQVINDLLMPSDDAKANRIPAIAEKAGTFKTLLAALKAAELATVLNGDGPFTVFAPTDDAFAKLPEGTVAKLLKPENRDQLVAILKYHVVSGSKSAKELVAAGSAKTLQSGSISASIVDGRLTVNQSSVLKTDIKAVNGIVHVIDRVLIPSKH